MENKLVSGIYGMEIRVIGKKILFPNTPHLENKRIKHIEFLKRSVLPKVPSGTETVDDINSMYITLVNRGTANQVIENLNVTSLNNKGDRMFINKVIDLQKSFIEYKGTENQINKSVFILFYYDEPAVWSAINVINQRTIVMSLELKLTGKKTYFAYNNDFLNKKILSLNLLFPAVSPLGNDCISSYNQNNKFITLVRNNLEFISNVPILIFYQKDLYYQIRLQGIKFDLQKSFIYSLTNTVDDLKSVFFNVVIDDNK